MSALVDVKTLAAGRWASVFNLLGLDSKYLNGKHQDCPLCGTGKDRFRWNRATEHAHCNQCGSYGPMDFAIAWTGKPYREAVKEVKQVLGVAKVENIQFQANDYEKNKARLKQIHKKLQVLGKSEEALRYFAQRGLAVTPEKDCYFCPSLAYYEDGHSTGEYSAIVSVFRNVNEETSSYHITYLDGSKKAQVSSPKKTLPAIRPLTGSSIQLFKPEKGVLAVAEGIESALSVFQNDGIACWAAGNARMLENIQIPNYVHTVCIYVDEDSSFTGQAAGYALAKRLVIQEKKKVQVIRLINELGSIQPYYDYGIDLDFNDYIVKNHD